MKVSHNPEASGTPDSAYRYDTWCDAGTYPAKVAKAEERISSKGNDMFDVVLNVDGSHGPAKLHLFATAGSWKLENLVEVLLHELHPAWVRGEVHELTADQFVGRSCLLVVLVEADERSGEDRPTAYCLRKAQAAPLEKASTPARATSQKTQPARKAPPSPPPAAAGDDGDGPGW